MVDSRGRSVPGPGAHRLSDPAMCWRPSRLSPPGTGAGDRRLAWQRVAKLLFLGSGGYPHQRKQANLVLHRLNAAHLLCPELRGLFAKTVGVPRLFDEALATKREHAGGDVDLTFPGPPVPAVRAAPRPLEDELRLRSTAWRSVHTVSSSPSGSGTATCSTFWQGRSPCWLAITPHSMPATLKPD